MRNAMGRAFVAPGKGAAGGTARPAPARRRGAGVDRRPGLRPYVGRGVEEFPPFPGDEDAASWLGLSSGETLDEGFDEPGRGLPEELDGLRAYLDGASRALATLAPDDDRW